MVQVHMNFYQLDLQVDLRKTALRLEARAQQCIVCMEEKEKLRGEPSDSCSGPGECHVFLLFGLLGSYHITTKPKKYKLSIGPGDQTCDDFTRALALNGYNSPRPELMLDIMIRVPDELPHFGSSNLGLTRQASSFRILVQACKQSGHCRAFQI